MMQNKMKNRLVAFLLISLLLVEIMAFGVQSAGAIPGSVPPTTATSMPNPPLISSFNENDLSPSLVTEPKKEENVEVVPETTTGTNTDGGLSQSVISIITTKGGKINCTNTKFTKSSRIKNGGYVTAELTTIGNATCKFDDNLNIFFQSGVKLSYNKGIVTVHGTKSFRHYGFEIINLYDQLKNYKDEKTQSTIGQDIIINHAFLKGSVIGLDCEIKKEGPSCYKTVDSINLETLPKAQFNKAIELYREAVLSGNVANQFKYLREAISQIKSINPKSSVLPELQKQLNALKLNLELEDLIATFNEYRALSSGDLISNKFGWIPGYKTTGEKAKEKLDNKCKELEFNYLSSTSVDLSFQIFKAQTYSICGKESQSESILSRLADQNKDNRNILGFISKLQEQNSKKLYFQGQDYDITFKDEENAKKRYLQEIFSRTKNQGDVLRQAQASLEDVGKEYSDEGVVKWISNRATTGAVKSLDLLLLGFTEGASDEYGYQYSKSQKEVDSGKVVESLYGRGILSFEDISNLKSLDLSDPSINSKLLQAAAGNKEIAKAFSNAINTFRNSEGYGKVSIDQGAEGYKIHIKNENNNAALMGSAKDFASMDYGFALGVLDMSAVDIIAMEGMSAGIQKGVVKLAEKVPWIDSAVNAASKAQYNPFIISNKIEKRIEVFITNKIGKNAVTESFANIITFPITELAIEEGVFGWAIGGLGGKVGGGIAGEVGQKVGGSTADVLESLTTGRGHTLMTGFFKTDVGVITPFIQQDKIDLSKLQQLGKVETLDMGVFRVISPNGNQLIVANDLQKMDEAVQNWNKQNNENLQKVNTQVEINELLRKASQEPALQNDIDGRRAGLEPFTWNRPISTQAGVINEIANEISEGLKSNSPIQAIASLQKYGVLDDNLNIREGFENDFLKSRVDELKANAGTLQAKLAYENTKLSNDKNFLESVQKQIDQGISFEDIKTTATSDQMSAIKLVEAYQNQGFNLKNSLQFSQKSLTERLDENTKDLGALSSYQKADTFEVNRQTAISYLTDSAQSGESGKEFVFANLLALGVSENDAQRAVSQPSIMDQILGGYPQLDFRLAMGGMPAKYDSTKTPSQILDEVVGKITNYDIQTSANNVLDSMKKGYEADMQKGEGREIRYHDLYHIQAVVSQTQQMAKLFYNRMVEEGTLTQEEASRKTDLAVLAAMAHDLGYLSERTDGTTLAAGHEVRSADELDKFTSNMLSEERDSMRFMIGATRMASTPADYASFASALYGYMQGTQSGERVDLYLSLFKSKGELSSYSPNYNGKTFDSLSDLEKQKIKSLFSATIGAKALGVSDTYYGGQADVEKSAELFREFGDDIFRTANILRSQGVTFSSEIKNDPQALVKLISEIKSRFYEGNTLKSVDKLRSSGLNDNAIATLQSANGWITTYYPDPANFIARSRGFLDYVTMRGDLFMGKERNLQMEIPTEFQIEKAKAREIFSLFEKGMVDNNVLSNGDFAIVKNKIDSLKKSGVDVAMLQAAYDQLYSKSFETKQAVETALIGKYAGIYGKENEGKWVRLYSEIFAAEITKESTMRKLSKEFMNSQGAARESKLVEMQTELNNLAKQNAPSTAQNQLNSVLSKAGKRSPDEMIRFADRAIESLDAEARKGEGKLNGISKISQIKSALPFVDRGVAYLPGKGTAIFIGDTHGEADSVLAILKQTRFLERLAAGEDVYLVFMGDYVDRGAESIKNLEMLLELQQKFSNNIFLLKGNHENPTVNNRYGFLNDFINLYGNEKGMELWRKYNSVFDSLPNALVTEKGVIVVHGGVPQGINSLQDLVGLSGSDPRLNQMLWDDPSEDVKGFIQSPRGGFAKEFGPDVFDKFMNDVGANIMLRAHNPGQAGNTLFGDRLLTLFSSSDPRVLAKIYGEVDLSKTITQMMNYAGAGVEGFNVQRINNEILNPQISDAKDFVGLFQILDSKGFIQGTTRRYSANDLKAIITRVKNGESIDIVTRTGGLRQKVAELMVAEEAGKVSDQDKQKSRTLAATSDESFLIVQISDARSFTELYDILPLKGPLAGSSKTYSPENLIELINGVRRTPANINLITQTAGLRGKVQELLIKEKGIKAIQAENDKKELRDVTAGKISEAGMTDTLFSIVSQATLNSESLSGGVSTGIKAVTFIDDFGNANVLFFRGQWSGEHAQVWEKALGRTPTLEDYKKASGFQMEFIKRSGKYTLTGDIAANSQITGTQADKGIFPGDENMKKMNDALLAGLSSSVLSPDSDPRIISSRDFEPMNELLGSVKKAISESEYQKRNAELYLINEKIAKAEKDASITLDPALIARGKELSRQNNLEIRGVSLKNELNLLENQIIQMKEKNENPSPEMLDRMENLMRDVDIAYAHEDLNIQIKKILREDILTINENGKEIFNGNELTAGQKIIADLIFNERRSDKTQPDQISQAVKRYKTQTRETEEAFYAFADGIKLEIQKRSLGIAAAYSPEVFKLSNDERKLKANLEGDPTHDVKSPFNTFFAGLRVYAEMTFEDLNSQTMDNLPGNNENLPPPGRPGFIINPATMILDAYNFVKDIFVKRTFEKQINQLENDGLLGTNLEKNFWDKYSQRKEALLNDPLAQKVMGENIMANIDRSIGLRNDGYYMSFIGKESPVLQEKIERYVNDFSSENAQGLISGIIDPSTKILYNSKGELSNFEEYLEDYYKELGVTIKVNTQSFNNLDLKFQDIIMTNLLKDKRGPETGIIEAALFSLLLEGKFDLQTATKNAGKYGIEKEFLEDLDAFNYLLKGEQQISIVRTGYGDINYDSVFFASDIVPGDRLDAAGENIHFLNKENIVGSFVMIKSKGTDIVSMTETIIHEMDHSIMKISRETAYGKELTTLQIELQTLEQKMDNGEITSSEYTSGTGQIDSRKEILDKKYDLEEKRDKFLNEGAATKAAFDYLLNQKKGFAEKGYANVASDYNLAADFDYFYFNNLLERLATSKENPEYGEGYLALELNSRNMERKDYFDLFYKSSNIQDRMNFDLLINALNQRIIPEAEYYKELYQDPENAINRKSQIMSALAFEKISQKSIPPPGRPGFITIGMLTDPFVKIFEFFKRLFGIGTIEADVVSRLPIEEGIQESETAAKMLVEAPPIKEPPILLGEITKIHPITKEETTSKVYRNIVLENVDELFQTNLEKDYGPDVYGTKAAVYFNDYGSFSLGFLTETEAVHHPHLIGMLVGGDKGKQIDSMLTYPEDVLTRSAGYQIQYNRKTGQIVGIDMDSHITSSQRGRQTLLRQSMIDSLDEALLDSIDESLLEQLLLSDTPLINIRPGLNIVK